MDKPIYDSESTHKRELTKEIQDILDHLDDADSKTAFIDMMHGHIGNEIYKGNN